MNLWQILNSPLVLTIVTLLGGGLVASTISAMWQRRAQQYAAKVQYAQEIINCYHAYVRLINGNKERLTGDRADEFHAQMLAQAKLARFLFRDPHAGEAWRKVSLALADAAGFKRSGHDEKANKLMAHVYGNAEAAIEAMYNELRR
jgi:hypothetical protein